MNNRNSFVFMFLTSFWCCCIFYIFLISSFLEMETYWTLGGELFSCEGNSNFIAWWKTTRNFHSQGMVFISPRRRKYTGNFHFQDMVFISPRVRGYLLDVLSIRLDLGIVVWVLPLFLSYCFFFVMGRKTTRNSHFPWIILRVLLVFPFLYCFVYKTANFYCSWIFPMLFWI